MRNASDLEIFKAAREANVTVISKDSDFVELAKRLGPPPQLVSLTCGNASNRRLRELFKKSFPDACKLLEAGAPVVEIGDIDP